LLTKAASRLFIFKANQFVIVKSLFEEVVKPLGLNVLLNSCSIACDGEETDQKSAWFY